MDRQLSTLLATKESKKSLALNKGTSLNNKTGDDNQTSLVLSIKGLNNLPRRDSDSEYKIEHRATKQPGEQAADQTEQQIEAQIVEQHKYAKAEHQTDTEEETEEETEDEKEGRLKI
ncbi:hypothetical protein N7451_002409 [Penicillium sp. IBT 35674x]|nr:hypothetical protein N7451_002409 [Penicillium sp. IBT 35674x]